MQKNREILVTFYSFEAGSIEQPSNRLTLTNLTKFSIKYIYIHIWQISPSIYLCALAIYEQQTKNFILHAAIDLLLFSPRAGSLG